jgi:hypothetical protein
MDRLPRERVQCVQKVQIAQPFPLSSPADAAEAVAKFAVAILNGTFIGSWLALAPG